ncbi:hypothetical protein BRADI_1g68705v3 [Brachypodium distachyon]|uniref:Uncharacterized protein n=1 Tax=Brachypodium distachyon TaxID=15368 RepID=A0A2K2DU17_BRADI|nr:hypothetical protein BRADI_1g68705v3 [Brachypodium distachyon]
MYHLKRKKKGEAAGGRQFGRMGRTCGTCVYYATLPAAPVSLSAFYVLLLLYCCQDSALGSLRQRISICRIRLATSQISRFGGVVCCVIYVCLIRLIGCNFL